MEKQFDSDQYAQQRKISDSDFSLFAGKIFPLQIDDQPRRPPADDGVQGKQAMIRANASNHCSSCARLRPAETARTPMCNSPRMIGSTARSRSLAPIGSARPSAKRCGKLPQVDRISHQGSRMTEPEPLARLHEVSRSIRDPPREVPVALETVSMAISPSEALVLMGGNGVGKSVTLSLLLHRQGCTLRLPPTSSL